jgi:hypothetical protein
MRRLVLIALGLGVLFLAPVGCGRDRGDRGLAPTDEQATPESGRDLHETQAERQAQGTQAEQSAEEHDFDQADDAKQAGQKPADGQ